MHSLILDVSEDLRHTCEQNEGMAGYGWTIYDARAGGIEVINDTGNSIDLVAEFVKLDVGSHWNLNLRGLLRPDVSQTKKTTVVLYLGSDDSTSNIRCSEDTTFGRFALCEGSATGLGGFRFLVTKKTAGQAANRMSSIQSMTIHQDTIWQAKHIFLNRLDDNDEDEVLLVDSPGEGNLHFVQMVFHGDFEVNADFSPVPDSRDDVSMEPSKRLQDTMAIFYDRFQAVYSPQRPFRDEQHNVFSQYLLANLMGGIGYFHGMGKVHTASPQKTKRDDLDSVKEEASVQEKGPFSLFSAVPSRPFFPRGFFWDEGFHLEVIMDWDMDLALEIVSSWFGLMDENGWIAREQVLGSEARSKVPPEFQTQFHEYANPPTLFGVVESFLSRLSGAEPYKGRFSHYLDDVDAGEAYVKGIYAKLHQYYHWFRRSQAGNLTNYPKRKSETLQGFRWRGRTPKLVLTSGLDDYPRAMPPHPEELHVDALCWVGFMAKTLESISAFLKANEKETQVFSTDKAEICKSIDAIHWSEADNTYCDTTMDGHTQVKKVCHKGYISIFPFITGLVSPDHRHLNAILSLIRDPEELWSVHGIRSLSPKDEYYGTDENYWRSPIWININYMVVKRLLDLVQGSGPHKHRARDIYNELRHNLVDTVFRSWQETGFAWEQYNPDTGKGQRTQHFTGWTALIVRIMAMPELRPDYALPEPGDSVKSAWLNRWQMCLLLVIAILLILGYRSRRRSLKGWKRLIWS